MESMRKAKLASDTARHEAYLKQREDEKQRRKREALRRIAPGFEPDSGPLVPTKMSRDPADGVKGTSVNDEPPVRDVMDDLVDHLAALDAASSSSPGHS